MPIDPASRSADRERVRSRLLRPALFSLAVLSLSALAVPAPAPAAAAPPTHIAAAAGRQDSGPATHHDTSAPLRTLHSPARRVVTEPAEDRDVQQLPHPAPGAADPVVQRKAATATAPPNAGFDGLGVGFTGPAGAFHFVGVPSDANSAVGPSSVVEMVNSSFAIFTKTGTVLYGPADDNTLWAGFGGVCETTNLGDPVVRYDAMAGRFVLSQFAGDLAAGGPYAECVAVSTTGDPTGTYYRYSFPHTDFPDYPKLGIWPDAYYLTFNLFFGSTLLGPQECGLDRAKMLQGLAATQQCFAQSTSSGGLLPADLDGSSPPPAGEPELLLALGTSSTTLSSWSMHLDWTTPAASSLTGPTPIAVAPYTVACGGGACVPQADTADRLDSLADRLMFRLAYRNLGDHEAFVVSHAVTVGSGVGVRWYELRPSGGRPTVFQQGTYAPDNGFRWMPSIAMDRSGGIGLGYSVSSAAMHPAVRYTGRLATDPPGVLTQGEGSMIEGAGSQLLGTRTRNRWGDYSSMSVDPDGCGFWYTNQYLPTTGPSSWRSRNATFSLPGCGVTAPDDFSLSATPWAATATAGATRTSVVSTATSAGAASSVTLTASGAPAGVVVTFSPATIPSGATSTMTVTTSASVAAGTYALTVTGTSGAVSHSAGYALTVKAPPSYLSVSDAYVSEGGGAAVFTVSRSGTALPASVKAKTGGGTAKAGTDYTALPSTLLSFAVGEASKTVAVPVTDDGVPEPSETFTLTLTSPVGAVLADPTGTATVVDNDSPAYLSVADVTVGEASGTAAFTVTRGGNTAVPVSVKYATANGTATAGTDYTALPSSLLSFAAGETTKTVPVTVASDALAEPNESFTLSLSSAVGAVVSDATGTATVVDDDPPVYLAVGDAVITEGNSGTTTVAFPITRSGDTAAAVSVRYATSNGSASAGSDYTAVPSTVLSFAAGVTSASVAVTVNGDTTVEGNETFSLALSSPVGATLSDAAGTATILNDDGTATPGPTTFFAASDIAVSEGDAGTTAATFTITRSGSTAATSSVHYATANGTATAGSDYTAVPSTTLSFAPGESIKTVVVAVTGDTAFEPDETFTLTLSSPSGAVISDAAGTVTVRNDDAAAYLAVTDVSAPESGTGVTFTVTRSGSTAAPVSVRYATVNGTATAGADYTALPSTLLTFAGGETSKTVHVTVLGDTLAEADETFSLSLSSAAGATLSDPTGVATIVDDDAPTYLSVGDLLTSEGSGPSAVAFTITRSGSTAGAVTVRYATSNGTATAGSDYTAIPSTLLSFAAGESSKQVAVTVLGDALAEADETFSLVLSSPAGAVLSDPTGVATLENDD